MSEVLVLEAISKTYSKGIGKRVQVLSNLSLRIDKGELVALVAPSGSGKSTLLHIAGLLDTPDSGRVVINGRDLAGQSDSARTEVRCRELGFIYQFHHLLPEFSAAENVILPQLANGVSGKIAQDRAFKLLGQVGLSHRTSHRPAQLSGGEQQRVAFCRALANTPGLLLADEPTGNLDPMASNEVLAVLISLVREKAISALIATHNMELASRMDRTILLINGGDGGCRVNSSPISGELI